jgi:glycosyltransferase involved in cell wall biosynthesis
MRIAIAGPISVRGLSKFLDSPVESLPVGHDGAPLLNTLITALIKKGYDVSAYTLDAAISIGNESIFTARGNNGLRVYVGPYRPHSFRPNNGKPGRMLDMFGYERQVLLEMIAQDKPDIIHAHWTYEFALAAIESGLPYVITAHDSPLTVLRYMPNLYRLGRFFMARRVLRKANLVTAVSPYLKKKIQRYAQSPIKVIGNPIPHHALENINKSVNRQRNLNRPRVAMVLSGWGRLKNPEAGLKAFSLLRHQLPDAQLYCFGYHYGKSEVAQQWAISHGLDSGVEFKGALPHHELLDSLGEMDVLLHPSLEESCPLTLLEAMAIGIAVVGGDKSGGVPWILDNGQAGVLTDIRSPEAMYDAMLHLLTNNDVYEHTIKSAKDRINKLFTPEAVLTQYEDVYRKALSAQAKHLAGE